MKDKRQETVLGILMQRDAERSAPDEAHAAATWQAISQAISQPAPAAKARSAEDRRSSLFEGIWNPRTAFGSQGEPHSSWRYPSRRLVIQALSLVLLIVLFLAAGLVFNRGGFMPADTRPTVTIPDDTIPLVNPNLPSASALQAFLPSSDSAALAGLPKLSPEQQRTGLEAICSKNGIALTRLPAGSQAATYWTGRRQAAGQGQTLVLLAREKAGQPGWTVVYQLIPASQALPAGADLDAYFESILATAKAG